MAGDEKGEMTILHLKKLICKSLERFCKKFEDALLKHIVDELDDLGLYAEIDNGKINFEMGGCGYNVYLSRGYICLEEEDNSSIENIYNVKSVSELVDLIKDLREDR